MASLLSCQGLTKAHSARPLFNGITFGLDEGDKVGLIGPNGSGKSTLLKILAGLEKPDAGQVSSRRNLRVAYVAQEESYAEHLTVRNVLMEAVSGAHLDSDEQARRVEFALAEAGFNDEAGAQTVGSLSGGWRKRLAICEAVLREPDLLLLAEPTNHLDLDGVVWLENYLQGGAFGYLVVTHDRIFLERIARRVIELNPAYAEGFLSVNGPYSAFLESRETYLSGQASQQEALESVVRREIEWLRRGAKARTTKAKGRIEQAGNLIADLAQVKQRNALSEAHVGGMTFSASGRKTREMVAAKSVGKSLGGRPILRDVDVVLSPLRRLGLVGPNGSGKTTLLRLLTGNLEPDTGTVKQADGLRIVWFEQDRGELDKTQTLRDALSPNGETVEYRGNSMHVSGWAKRFLFRTDQLNQQVGQLSGGEQARVLIARLMLQSADILVLDEPTNDLDIPSLEVLEEGLVSFPGAVILVTHDRYLLERVSTEVLGLVPAVPKSTSGREQVLDGAMTVHLVADYEQYEAVRKQAEAQIEALTRPASKPEPMGTPAPSRSLSTPERRELAQIEGKIEKAEAKVTELETALTTSEVATDAVRLKQTWDDLEAAKEAVKKLYERWEELESQ